MSEMKNPAVVVSLKEGGEFKCDLTVEDRPVPDYKDDEVMSTTVIFQNGEVQNAPQMRKFHYLKIICAVEKFSMRIQKTHFFEIDCFGRELNSKLPKTDTYF